VITLKNINKVFKVYDKPSHLLKEVFLRRPYHRSFHALKNISFTLEPHDVLGIIGRNGAGKSTLLKILAGVLMADEGEIQFDGRLVALLELGTGFDMTLNGIKNIYINGLLLGMSSSEINARRDDIIAFAELGDFINEPLRIYSSGMVMRLAFSIAVHSQPDCLIVDEVLAVGDAHFQQKCIKAIRDISNRGGVILFVSHDINAVKVVCNKAIVLENGESIYEGAPDGAVNCYNRTIAGMDDDEERMFSSDNEQAYGTGGVSLLEAAIAGEKSSGAIMSSGETSVISLAARVNNDIDDLCVGILIRDRFGQDVYGVNTQLLGQDIVVKKGETYLFTFRMALNLAPGKYSITVGFHGGRAHTENCYYFCDNQLRFDVAGFTGSEFVGLCRLVTDFGYENHVVIGSRGN